MGQGWRQHSHPPDQHVSNPGTTPSHGIVSCGRGLHEPIIIILTTVMGSIHNILSRISDGRKDLDIADLWECHTMGIHGVRYFISFIDNHTQCIALKFLKMKDQAIRKFQNYVAYLKCQYDLFPKCFHTDNGSEYITGDLQRWCASKGIRLEYTVLYSPVQNGVAERMNHTLAELARAMILSTKMPTFLWPEAITHVTYLCNWTHMQALDMKTPLEAWCGHKLDVSHLQEFRSPVWILTEGQLSKMQPQSIKHTFMGFIDGPKAIKYYDASTRQVRVS